MLPLPSELSDPRPDEVLEPPPRRPESPESPLEVPVVEDESEESAEAADESDPVEVVAAAALPDEPASDAMNEAPDLASPLLVYDK